MQNINVNLTNTIQPIKFAINLSMLKFRNQRSLSQSQNFDRKSSRKFHQNILKQHKSKPLQKQQNASLKTNRRISSKPQVSRTTIQQVLLRKSGTTFSVKSNLLENYVKGVIVKMLKDRKNNFSKKQEALENQQRQEFMHESQTQSRQFSYQSQNSGNHDKRYYSQQHFRRNSNINPITYANNLPRRSSTQDIQTTSQKFQKVSLTKNNRKQKRSHGNFNVTQDIKTIISPQLINPCSLGFKYCINDKVSNKLKSSLLSHDYLLEPCKISPFVLERRPCTAMDDSFTGNLNSPMKKNGIRSMLNYNSQLAQQNNNNFEFFDSKNRRYLRNGMTNYLEQLRDNRKKSTNFLRKALPNQEDIQPWQGAMNQQGETQNLYNDMRSKPYQENK